MKTRAKRIILSLIYITLTIVSISGIYGVLSWKDTSGEYFSSLAELKQLPDNTVDVVALGSSRAYGTFDVSFLWNKAGISAFNLSIAGMAQKSAYYHLVEFLKTQSPKVVFLEGSLLYTDGYLDQGNVYRNTIVMAPSKNNLELIEATVGKENGMEYALRFPIVHSRYKELSKADFRPSSIDKGRLGFVPGFDCISITDVDFEVLDSDGYVEASNETRKWIESLYELSKEKDFDIVFYLAPQNIMKPYKERYNGACKVLDEYGISHIDFNELRNEIGFDYLADLSDAMHCNDKGALKVMDYLCDYLTDNYDFNDNREDARYERWNKNAAYIANERAENGINDLDIADAVKLLSDIEDVILVECSASKVKVCLNNNIEFELNEQSGDYHIKINDSDYCYVTALMTDKGLNTIVYFGQTPYYLHGDNTNLYVAYDLVRDDVVYYKEY